MKQIRHYRKLLKQMGRKDHVEVCDGMMTHLRGGGNLEGSGIWDTIKHYASKVGSYFTGKPAAAAPPPSPPRQSAPPPRQSAPPPQQSRPAPKPAPKPAMPSLSSLGITNRAGVLKWMAKNHPDKGGDTAVFQNILAEAKAKGFLTGNGRYAYAAYA